MMPTVDTNYINVILNKMLQAKESPDKVLQEYFRLFDIENIKRYSYRYISERFTIVKDKTKIKFQEKVEEKK